MNNMNGRHHTFDSGLAITYGVEEAILIQHFQHWIAFNKSQGKNFREGRTWMFQSRKQMMGYLIYWNYDKIKYLCEKLVNIGILITDNFSKGGLDRTLWYAFADEKEFGIGIENENKFTKGKSAQSKRNFENVSKKSINSNDLKECLRKGKSAQWMGKSAQCYNDKDSKEEDTKEIHMSAPPASVRLAQFFFDTLREVNPKQKKPNLDKWAKDFDRMMRVDQRTEYDIMTIIKHMIHLHKTRTGEFSWFSWVQSPDKLREKFDKLTVIMNAKASSPVNSEEEDKYLVDRVLNKFSKRKDITAGYNYIEFDNGREPCHLKFGEKDFRAKVLQQLQKRNLPTDGL